MPSRLRSTHSKTFDIGSWLVCVAKRIEAASLQVERELLAEASEMCRLVKRTSAQLRSKGGLVPGPDGKEQILIEGHLWTATPHPDAAHTGTNHPHQILSVGPADVVAEIQDLADLFATLNVQVTPLKNRSKRSPSGERTKIRRCVRRLVQWAIEHGLTSVGGGNSRLHPNAKSRAQLNPGIVHCIAVVHLHCGVSCENPCQKLGVCRALFHLRDGIDSPLKRAIRNLAQTLFDMSGSLVAAVTRIQSENPGIVPQPRQVDLGTDSGAVAPETAGLLSAAVAQLMELAEFTKELEELIRRTCLVSPSDHARRGRRCNQSLLVGATLDLRENGFSEESIMWFLDDGFGKDERRRAKRLRSRLRVEAKHPSNSQTRHVPPATEEQIIAARKEPEFSRSSNVRGPPISET